MQFTNVFVLVDPSRGNPFVEPIATDSFSLAALFLKETCHITNEPLEVHMLIERHSSQNHCYKTVAEPLHVLDHGPILRLAMLLLHEPYGVRLQEIQVSIAEEGGRH